MPLWVEIRKSQVSRLVAAVLLAVLAILAAGPAPAQDPAAAESDTTATAAADTVQAPAAGTGLAAFRQGGFSAGATGGAATGPWLQSVSNKPKSGVKASVRQYTYYGENVTAVAFRDGAFTNTASWSWDDFRKLDKAVEKRSDTYTYNPGQVFPFTMTLTGAWDWSEDISTNTAGFTNLSKRDMKNSRLELTKTKYRTGRLIHSVKAEARYDDQKSINQGQRNDLSEGTLAGGIQTGLELSRGLSLAGRLHGSTTSGSRTLGEFDSPSSASSDSAGFGVYYDRRVAAGRVSVTRSSFDKRYLDFKRNSNGQIDTIGLANQDKVVEELETHDAVTLEFENTFRLRRMKLQAKVGRDMDESDYRVSGAGYREREQDQLDLAWSFGVGRDSLSFTYKLLWKWDDQRIKGATLNRGRQYTKVRDYDFLWMRPLFGRTMMTCRYHEGLTQDIAEAVYNQNDKDRLLTDVSVRLDRDWTGRFKTGLLFSYKQAQDIAIRESRSSNNNVKDSYEIAPTYVWDIAPWLQWDQSYQVYIQYTDYLYSYLESVSRDDDYNKRGNITTKVTVMPTERLDIIVRHDYNKRFNATRIVTDASGNSYYHTDTRQNISKIDLGLTFRAAQGVTFEGATYQTEDVKDSYGLRESTTSTRSGEVWVGVMVNKKWGKTNPLELSAMVKKFNAYGPAVNETSADYWEADVWLKWEF